MAYVLALQVTLALSLNAWLPADLAYAFGEICHTQVATSDARSDDGSASTDPAPVNAAAHCPLCVTPGFALMSSPDATAVVLRRSLGIVFETTRTAIVVVHDVHSPHHARAPPVAG